MIIYKSVNGFLNGMRKIADKQEMSMLKGWDKLTPEAQDLMYGLLAGIQNDISELEEQIQADKK